MNKRGSFGISMAQRVGIEQSPHQTPARHCWVVDPADRSGRLRPGLLVDWHHTDADEWVARVVYAAEMRRSEWATVEEWLPAALVRPA